MQLQKEFTVDFKGTAITYTLVQMPPTKSIKIATKLIKIVGEPLLALAANPGGLQSQISQVLPDVIRILKNGLDEDEVIGVIHQVFAYVQRDGKAFGESSVFDNEFRGKLSIVFKILLEQLKFNYSDFLGGAAE